MAGPRKRLEKYNQQEQERAEKLRKAARDELRALGMEWDDPRKGPELRCELEDNTLELLGSGTGGDVAIAEPPRREKRGLDGSVRPGKDSGNVPNLSLPNGWKIAHFDDHRNSASEKVPMFWHASSGCATFLVPKDSSHDASEMAGIKHPHSEGWKTLRDDKSGQFYFWNYRTGSVVWNIIYGEGAAPISNRSHSVVEHISSSKKLVEKPEKPSPQIQQSVPKNCQPPLVDKPDKNCDFGKVATFKLKKRGKR